MKQLDKLEFHCPLLRYFLRNFAIYAFHPVLDVVE